VKEERLSDILLIWRDRPAPTDAGVRLISHDGSWSKSRSSGKQPTAIDVEFAPESS
jgi:hypothetical protein